MSPISHFATRTLLLLTSALVAFPVACAEPSTSKTPPRFQDDFYTAVNFRWLNTAKIPADKSEIYAVQTPEVVRRRVASLLGELSSRQHKLGSVEQKLADYVTSIINTKYLDTHAYVEIDKILAELNAISNQEQLAQWQGKYHGIIKMPIWLWGGFADFSNPSIYRNIGMQGGLGLPARDMYLSKGDANIERIQKDYRQYLQTLAGFAHIPNAKATEAAQAVFELETKIARAHMADAGAINPAHIQTVKVTELETFAPGFPWHSMMREAAVKSDDSINLMQPNTVKALAQLYQTEDLEVWKNYFKFRMLNELAPVSANALRASYHHFQNEQLRGLKVEQDRKEYAIAEVSDALSEALAKAYVGRYFPEKDKTKIKQIIDDLRDAATTSIRQSTTMSEATREEAIAKLQSLRAKIAYPDTWRDYSKLEIHANDAIGNRQRAKRFEWERQAALSGKAVDRALWMMSPLEVNAYYDPSLNEINLPAAFLQAPMFDPKADDAVNYGRLGAFIAHEISHGFDNNGSQFDSHGVMRNWWSEKDAEVFREKEKQLISFYSQQEILPGKFVNGALTVPENMADIIGLQMAFKAYQKRMMKSASSEKLRLKKAQQFFVENAKNWAVLRRDERILELLSTDPHSPNKIRTNATIMHVDGFHEAFKTKNGDKLFLKADQRFRFW